MKTTYLLRLTKELKQELEKRAKDNGLTLNAYIITVLIEHIKNKKI